MNLQSFAKVTILFQSIWHVSWVITLWRSLALPNLVRWANRRHVVATYAGTVLFMFFCFFYSSTELQPIPVIQFSRTIAQKTRSGVRKILPSSLTSRTKKFLFKLQFLENSFCNIFDYISGSSKYCASSVCMFNCVILIYRVCNCLLLIYSFLVNKVSYFKWNQHKLNQWPHSSITT